MTDNLYDALGVKADASPEEIKRAGRKAQKRTHPDAGGDAEAFRKVTNALIVLLDPEKREHYDATGEADFRKGADNATNMAMDVLAQMISRATATSDPRYLSLPNEVRRLVNENIANLNRQLDDHEHRANDRLKKLDGFLKRLKRKTGQDMIGMILSAERNTLTRELAAKRAHTQQFLRVNSQALEMLADYEYAVDAPPQGAAGVFTQQDLLLQQAMRDILMGRR